MQRTDTYSQIKKAAELFVVSANSIRIWGREDRLSMYRHPVESYRLYRKHDLERLRMVLRAPKRAVYIDQ